MLYCNATYNRPTRRQCHIVRKLILKTEVPSHPASLIHLGEEIEPDFQRDPYRGIGYSIIIICIRQIMFIP